MKGMQSELLTGKSLGSKKGIPGMTVLTSLFEKNIFAKFPPVIHPLLQKVLGNNAYLHRKVNNFLLNEFEMKMHRSVLKSYPYYMVIDPTNVCNLKCPLCPTWQDTKSRPKGRMRIGTFRKLLDETGPYLFAVNLCNWGEPLLNPDLPSMIRYAKHYNTVTGLSTNLNYLPDETARELVESGTDIIIVSLDGATQESYERYRKDGNLQEVLRNIEKLNAYRGNDQDFPLLIWQFLVNRYNEAEIGKARDMAAQLGMQFFPSPMRTSMGKELLLPLHERVMEMKEWLPGNPEYNRYAYEITPETRTRQETCRWLWNSTVVNWDGSVSPCCGVFEKTWDFATSRPDPKGKSLTLHQAWNSPRYRLARKLVSSHMKDSRHKTGLLMKSAHEGLICAKCVQFGFLEE